MAGVSRHKSMASGCKAFEACWGHPKKRSGEKCLEKKKTLSSNFKSFPLVSLGSSPHSSPILLGLGGSEWLQLHKAEFWLGPIISEASSGLEGSVWGREVGRADLLWCSNCRVRVCVCCEGKTLLAHGEQNAKAQMTGRKSGVMGTGQRTKNLGI